MQMVDLCAEISFDIVTDELKAITVDKVNPVVTLAALNVQVSPVADLSIAGMFYWSDLSITGMFYWSAHKQCCKISGRAGVRKGVAVQQAAEGDEYSTTNDEFSIKDDEHSIINDDFCIKHDVFCV